MPIHDRPLQFIQLSYVEVTVKVGTQLSYKSAVVHYMAAVSRTSEFRQILSEKETGLPEKRRKLSRNPKRSDAQAEGDVALSKEYVAEAYVVVRIA